MIFPIAHSLHYPEPLPFLLKEYEEPENWPDLKFYTVDEKKYPGFSLCIKAGKIGLSAPLILNASNEVAVELFLEDKIHFTEIPFIIQDSLNNIPLVEIKNLDILLKEDKKVREYIYSKYNKLLSLKI
jgi:1-deoxy-D-xylulose-5-phosphate reductoisomerase